jgi:hypothetical protein
MCTFTNSIECNRPSSVFSGLWGSKYPAEYANLSPAESFKSLVNNKVTAEHGSQPSTNDKDCVPTCRKWLARAQQLTDNITQNTSDILTYSLLGI